MIGCPTVSQKLHLGPATVTSIVPELKEGILLREMALENLRNATHQIATMVSTLLAEVTRLWILRRRFVARGIIDREVEKVQRS